MKSIQLRDVPMYGLYAVARIGGYRQIRSVSTARSPALKKTPPGRAKSFEPDVAKAFGEVIRTERVKQQVAQDAFALLAGIDRSYYGKLERGERQPSIALMLRIAAGLGCPAATLVRKLETALQSHGPGRPPIAPPETERSEKGKA